MSCTSGPTRIFNRLGRISDVHYWQTCNRPSSSVLPFYNQLTEKQCCQRNSGGSESNFFVLRFTVHSGVHWLP